MNKVDTLSAGLQKIHSWVCKAELGLGLELLGVLCEGHLQIHQREVMATLFFQFNLCPT